MASAYSLIKNTQEYIAPYNTDQLMQIAAYKQQQYDTNVQLVDQALSNIANIELYKDIDQQYLNARLQKVVADINKGGGADLSSSAITRNTVRHVMKAVDDNVMQAMDSTTRIKRDLAEIEKSMTAGDGTYAIQNEAYTKEAIARYGSSDTLTTRSTKYISNSYTPYRNVEAAVDKAVKDLLDLRGETTVDTPTGDGYIVRKKVKNLSIDELRAVAYQTLTPDDQRQLQINGWYKYGNNTDDQVVQLFSNYTTGKAGILDAEIGRRETSLNSLTGDARESELINIESLKREKKELENRSNNILRSGRQAMTSFLETEGIVESLSFKYSRNPTSYTVSKDDAYFEAEKQRIDWFEAQNPRTGSRTGTSGTRGSANGAETEIPRIYSTGLPTTVELTTLDKEKAIISDIDNYKNISRNEARELYRKLSTTGSDPLLDAYQTPSGYTVQDLIKNSRSEAISDLAAQGITNPSADDIDVATISKLFESDSNDLMRNMSDSTLNLVKRFQSNLDAYNTRSSYFRNKVQTAGGEFQINFGTVGTEMTNGFFQGEAAASIVLPWGETLRDFIDQNNLRDPQAFEQYIKDNPSQGDYISSALSVAGMASGIADYVDTLTQQEERSFVGQLFTPQTNTADSNIRALQNGKDYLVLPSDASEETIRAILQNPVSTLSQSIGENYSVDDLFSFTRDTNRNIVVNIKGNSNPTVNRMLNTYFKPQQVAPYGVNDALINTSPGARQQASMSNQIRTSAGLSSNANTMLKDVFYSRNSISPAKSAAIDEMYGNLPESRLITIMPDDTQVHEELGVLMSSYAQFGGNDVGGGAPVDSKNPINIRRSSTPGTVIISQSTSKFGTKGNEQTQTVTAEVPVSEISGNVLQYVNLEDVTNAGSFRGIPIPVKPVSPYLDAGQDIGVISYYEQNGSSLTDIQKMTNSGAYEFIETYDAGKWLSTDLDKAMSRGLLNQQQADAIRYIRTGTADILRNPQGVGIGTHRKNGRLFVDLQVGDYKTAIDTGQSGDSALAAEKAISTSRNVGLTTVLASLLAQAQLRGRTSTAASNEALTTYQKIIEAFNKNKRDNGQLIQGN